MFFVVFDEKKSCSKIIFTLMKTPLRHQKVCPCFLMIPEKDVCLVPELTQFNTLSGPLSAVQPCSTVLQSNICKKKRHR